MVNSNKISDIKPYVLLLLPKENHWFNEYANKDLLDLEAIVQHCHSAISPHGLNLVIKRHPREKNKVFSKNIMKKNITIYQGDLSKAAKKCEIVIFTGTTSGLETLLLGKQVIQLGKHSSLPIKSKKDLPLNIVEKLSDLKKEFNKVYLKQKFDKRKVIILLDAIFKNSNYLKNSKNGTNYQVNHDRSVKDMKDFASYFSNQVLIDFAKN